MKVKFTQLPAVEHPALTDVIVRTERHGGYWGRGKTVADAIRAAEWIQSQDAVYVCQCDESAHCDAVSGNLLSDARGPLYRGKVMANKRDVLVTEEYSPARLNA